MGNGLGAQAQAQRDLVVGQTGGNLVQNLDFTPRQRFDAVALYAQ